MKFTNPRAAFIFFLFSFPLQILIEQMCWNPHVLTIKLYENGLKSKRFKDCD